MSRTVNATACGAAATRHIHDIFTAWLGAHSPTRSTNGRVASAYKTVSSYLNFAVGLIYVRTGSNAVDVQLLRAKNEHALKEVGGGGGGPIYHQPVPPTNQFGPGYVKKNGGVTCDVCCRSETAPP